MTKTVSRPPTLIALREVERHKRMKGYISCEFYLHSGYHLIRFEDGSEVSISPFGEMTFSEPEIVSH